MSQAWYVIRTEAHSEHLAELELEKDGHQILLPRVKVVRTRLGHMNGPLFPGYLFIRCDLDREDRPALARAPHVRGWVSFGGFIPSVPDAAMEELIGQVQAINQGGGLWQRFRVGQSVYVDSPPWHELAKVLEEAKSPRHRVRVLLSFMGHQVAAQVPWEHLKPVEDRSGGKSKVPRRTRGGGRWIRGFEPGAAQSL